MLQQQATPNATSVPQAKVIEKSPLQILQGKMAAEGISFQIQATLGNLVEAEQKANPTLPNPVFLPLLKEGVKVYANESGSAVFETGSDANKTYLVLSDSRERMIKKLDFSRVEKVITDETKRVKITSFVKELLRSPIFHEYDKPFDGSRPIFVVYPEKTGGAPESVYLYNGSEQMGPFELDSKKNWPEYAEFFQGLRPRKK